MAEDRPVGGRGAYDIDAALRLEEQGLYSEADRRRAGAGAASTARGAPAGYALGLPPGLSNEVVEGLLQHAAAGHLSVTLTEDGLVVDGDDEDWIDWDGGGGGGGPEAGGPARGLTDAELAALTTTAARPEGGSGGALERDCCPICLDGFTAGGALLELPCRHRFHLECGRGWFGKRRTCPTCRRSAAAGEAAGERGGAPPTR